MILLPMQTFLQSRCVPFYSPEAAVIVWMRHRTTAYDNMAIPRVKGKRREVRRLLAQQSDCCWEFTAKAEPSTRRNVRSQRHCPAMTELPKQSGKHRLRSAVTQAAPLIKLAVHPPLPPSPSDVHTCKPGNTNLLPPVYATLRIPSKA